MLINQIKSLKIFIVFIFFLFPFFSKAEVLYSQLDSPVDFSNPPWGGGSGYAFATSSFVGNASTTQSVYVTFWLKVDSISNFFRLSINQNCSGSAVINLSNYPELADSQFHKITYETTISTSPSYCQNLIEPFITDFGVEGLVFKTDTLNRPYMVISTIPDDPILNDVSGILTFTSPNNQTYLTNPILFSGTYNNLDTFNFIQYDLEYGSSSVIFPNTSLNLVNGTDLTWSDSRILPYQGYYRVRSRLYDSSTSSTTPWTDWIEFGLGSTSTVPFQDEALGNCDGITDFGCHFKNSMIWLFKPSADSVSAFYNLDDSLEKRIPFVYAYQVPSLYNSLFTSSSTATTSISVSIGEWDITFLSADMLNSIPNVALVKSILGWLFWLMTFTGIYYQILRIHNKETQ